MRDSIGAATWKISVQSAIKHCVLKGYPNLTPPCGGHFEPTWVAKKSLN